MTRFSRSVLIALLLLAFAFPSFRAAAADQAPHASSTRFSLCFRCVQGDMNFLAADELHGRGSGTRDEHLAALFAASLFADFGLQPGGDNGTFLQKAPLPAHLPDRALKQLKGFSTEPRTETWNAVGILSGSDPIMREDAILLTAHLDHLGIGPEKDGDAIYNGADDDASGTTAVIELARALARGPRPRRTILFVLFGSEEIGGFGNQYFLAHPPVPLERIVANLEFEMIGRSDPAVGRQDLWLTGYDRSDLGPMLARHGAHLVADPHPAQNFFQRSDNYYLARKGIIAQTVSSFGLHADYHQPSDELSKIDFEHLDSSISSMVDPIDWLANTRWKPQWRPGGKP